MNRPILPYNITLQSIMKMVDCMYDEVLIYDNNYNIVYINYACRRHYDCLPADMIGKNFFDFVDDDCWNPSILPIVYKEKKAYAIKQQTFLGKELFTIAVPIFDDQNNIQYVIMNVHDDMSTIQVYNPNYKYQKDMLQNQDAPIACSPNMKTVLDMAERMSTVDTTCILSGESGTGKTMLAKYIHCIGNRKKYPFISLNCASIPDNLVESELFGYEKGAFTGANSKGKKGIFETANHGTLLLDEISELPLSAQAKLLHVLQEQSYLPVGGNTPVHVNVRVIAATNKNLKDLVANKQFREDLYYRLNIIELYIPPLRKRKLDIPLLTQNFLKHFNQKYHSNKMISDSALKILENAEWKGNIRELRHTIERLVVTNDDVVIDVAQLPKNMFGIVDVPESIVINPNASFDEKISQYEAALVRDAFKKCSTSRKMATYLEISQTRASNLIRKYINNLES